MSGNIHKEELLSTCEELIDEYYDAVIKVHGSEDVISFAGFTSWLLQTEYGNNVIIVHQPSNLPYFITTSSNLPFRTEQIITDLAERLRN